MACNPRQQHVTLDREALKALVRQRINARLAALNGGLSHTNHDGYYSPARWWVDRARTIRHSMSTSGSVSYSYPTITITLTYHAGTTN